MQKYSENLPKTRHVRRQRRRQLQAVTLANSAAKVTFHELVSVIDIAGTVDTGTYPRLVQVVPILDEDNA